MSACCADEFPHGQQGPADQVLLMVFLKLEDETVVDTGDQRDDSFDHENSPNIDQVQ
jgi:hypothetical protein